MKLFTPAHRQRGATLLVTLGVLTIITVLAVTFFSISRLQRRTGDLQQYRQNTRDKLDEALYWAMSTIQDAMTPTNFIEGYTPEDDAVQRLAPVEHWFSHEWQSHKKTHDDYSFQHTNILTSPLLSAHQPETAWQARLFTSEVLALIPPALTNALAPDRAEAPKAGWQIIDEPRYRHQGTRIAFAAVDLSGYLDANYFVTGPTTQQYARIAFQQSDTTNWWETIETSTTPTEQEILERLEHDRLPHHMVRDIPDPEAFSFLSYDPDPDTVPLAADSIAPHPLLGHRTFAHLRQRKFNLNVLTNIIETAAQDSSSGDWTLSGRLMSDWLRPVADAAQRANQDTDLDPQAPLNPHQVATLPWSLINFMDEDRIPQISTFAEGLDLPTRHNGAIEDVPLINKVTIFNIFAGQGDNNDPTPPAFINRDYYGNQIPPGDVSNHYGVAVELWYPFAPNTPPPSSATYVGIYTNASDVGNTTTNWNLSGDEVADWLRWDEAATSNTIMQTLFTRWGNAYLDAVDTNIWFHPLWQTITTNSAVWFTPDMSNTTYNANWPVADTNGLISITNSPIWQAFYPETYEVYTTNLVEVVETNAFDEVTSSTLEVITTNVYTYTTITNDYFFHFDDPTTGYLLAYGTSTNAPPYPLFLWQDLDNETIYTNAANAWLNQDWETLYFVDDEDTLQHYLLSLDINSSNQWLIVVSNVLSETLYTNTVEALSISAWPWEEGPNWSVQTNFLALREELPVPPLPMPEELGATLDVLFDIMLNPVELLGIDLQLNTSARLYDFLMLMTDDATWLGALGNSLADYPFVQNTIMPSHTQADLGNLNEEDRIDLTDAGAPDARGTLIVPQAFDGTDAGDVVTVSDQEGFGTYWVVYPRKVASFPEIVEIAPPEDNFNAEPEVVTNYWALGSKPDYQMWVRPVVTLNTNGAPDRATDIIVDEALLERQEDTVRQWAGVTNLCVADPRHNAYADYWRGFPHPNYPLDANDWESALFTTNSSTEVTEYPFIHLNRPLESIGELGHLYYSPDRLNLSGLSQISDLPEEHPRRRSDTLTFALRNDAALLDLFTTRASETNLPPAHITRPTRGLVQANTTHLPVLEALFAQARLGWESDAPESANDAMQPLATDNLPLFAEVYHEALLSTLPLGSGWRSLADMLPALSTNASLRTSYTPPDGYPTHDWIEDVVRHLPDYVSFRQNIYLIILAAQTLGENSTIESPVVLADQRAAVVIIRDAYTGRWALHSWRWLSE